MEYLLRSILTNGNTGHNLPDNGIYTLSNSGGDLIAGGLNPASEKGKLDLKSSVENIFIGANNNDNKTVLLSVSGRTKENEGYFNSVLSKMGRKYPSVNVLTLDYP